MACITTDVWIYNCVTSYRHFWVCCIECFEFLDKFTRSIIYHSLAMYVFFVRELFSCSVFGWKQIGKSNRLNGLWYEVKNHVLMPRNFNEKQLSEWSAYERMPNSVQHSNVEQRPYSHVMQIMFEVELTNREHQHLHTRQILNLCLSSSLIEWMNVRCFLFGLLINEKSYLNMVENVGQFLDEIWRNWADNSWTIFLRRMVNNACSDMLGNLRIGLWKSERGIAYKTTR